MKSTALANFSCQNALQLGNFLLSLQTTDSRPTLGGSRQTYMAKDVYPASCPWQLGISQVHTPATRQGNDGCPNGVYTPLSGVYLIHCRVHQGRGTAYTGVGSPALPVLGRKGMREPPVAGRAKDEAPAPFCIYTANLKRQPAKHGSRLAKKQNIMTFNELEMSSISKLAMAMAAADGVVKQEELAAIALELAKFGVNPDAAKRILKTADTMEYPHAIGVVASMNDRQKKYVTGFLAAVMAADGEIAKSELAMWSLISTLASLPTMTIAEALIFWNNN